MKAWYFSNNDCRLRYGDNRPIAPGIVHKVSCKPVLCNAGLHGSKRIIDALRYAPGGYVWRVDLSGDMVIGDDKIAATRREYLWGYDASGVLRRFARLCALDWDVRWDSVWDAAWASVRASAWDSAWDVGWDSAWDAAWDDQNRRLYRMIMRGHD